jgi:hypothetical protein
MAASPGSAELLASPVEAILLLCDAASADPAGKIHMLGAGWSVTSSPTAPMAVAMFLKIPWNRANQKLPLVLELRDADGRPVSPGHGEPLRIPADVEVGRPPGVEPGSMLDAAYTFAFGPLPIPPGRYEWRLTFAGQVFSVFFAARQKS